MSLPDIADPAEKARLQAQGVLRSRPSRLAVFPNPVRPAIPLDQYEREKAIIRRIARLDYLRTRKKQRTARRMQAA